MKERYEGKIIIGLRSETTFEKTTRAGVDQSCLFTEGHNLCNSLNVEMKLYKSSIYLFLDDQ